MYRHAIISDIFTKGNNFCDFLFVSLHDKTLPRGYYSIGKNLLPKEQILFFKRWPEFSREARLKLIVESPEIVLMTLTALHNHYLAPML